MSLHRWPDPLRFSLGVLFGLLALFSFLCIAFSFDDGVATGLSLALFFAGVGAGCGWIANLLLRPFLRGRGRAATPARATTQPDATLEHQVLALAATLGRPLSIAEVALRCNVSLEQSKAALRALVHAGVADPTLDDRNDLVYTITALRLDER